MGHVELKIRSSKKEKKRPFPFLIFLFLGLSFLAATVETAEDPDQSSPGLRASLDRESAYVGSIIQLTLDYRLPEGGRLPADPVIKGLEDLTVLEQQQTPEQIQVTLLADRLGPFRTGALSLTYIDQNGDLNDLTTEAVSLPLQTNLGEKPEDAQLRPIQGIISTSMGWVKHIPWAAGLLALLVVIGLLAWWSQKRRSRVLNGPYAEPPHIRAKKEIEKLDSAGLFEKGMVKVFYFRLSEILRRYLESIRGFPAAEFTTEEITRFIHYDQDRKLIPILKHADLVKFAGTVPTSAKKEEEVKAALAFIYETAPVTETGESEGESQGGRS